MEVTFDEISGTFAIAELTFEQLDHILNCIAFATEHDARMPKEKDSDPNRKRINIERAKRYRKQ